MERVTIYAVASAANVSISTVSNALNKPERVNAETLARVLTVADELGYVPSERAVALARRRTHRVGVMAPFTSYGSYLRRLSGVLDAASEKGVDIVVYDHESAAVASSPVLAGMPIHGRLDGLIVMGLEIEGSIAERLHHRGLPTVALDAGSDRFSRIISDDVEGGRIAAAHLVERGHRRLGYLLERQVSDYESQAVKRLAGFREVAERAGATVEVLHSGNSVAQARAEAGRLLEGADRPSAVMAHHDLLAVGVVLAARDLGLRVPDDVAVMGCDDGEAAVAADLTTVRQPFERSGRVAFEMVQRGVAGDRTTVVLDLELVVRSTT
ncbi:LacI family DNA-binding transcriptional regulator [Terrabacter aeriphilus]|uniref:LacI family DNA-binding transcriptional regulator n=1 Tax=Terrabacter aeriphilus TaxID=515662 RepID=A0ABP9JFI2_9MICO